MLKRLKFKPADIVPGLEYTKVFVAELRLYQEHAEFEIKLNCRYQNQETSEWVDDQIATDAVIRRDMISGVEKSLVREYNMWQVLIWGAGETPISLHYDIEDTKSVDEAYKALVDYYLYN